MDDPAYSSLAVPIALSGQKLPLGLRADGDMTRKWIAFAFILGTIAVFLAFPLGILGIVLSSMGMNRVSTEPETARKLVAWSWAILAITDCIAVSGIVVAVILR